MSAIKYLRQKDFLIIINNISFLEQKGPTGTIIHFIGGKNLEVNININSLLDLIEKEIEK